MDGATDRISEITLFIIVAIVFLAHKQRWRESRFMFALSGAMVLGAVGRLFVFLGPEPKIPIFLTGYSILAVVLFLLGLRDRSKERAIERGIVPQWHARPNE